MLEGKTANNIVDRYHRIITGDQNQIQAGGNFATCKITSLSIKENGVSSGVPCSMTCVCHDTPLGSIAGGITTFYDGETDDFDLILYNGYGMMYVNGSTVTAEGNAEVQQIVGSYYGWLITYTGDFSLSITLVSES